MIFQYLLSPIDKVNECDSTFFSMGFVSVGSYANEWVLFWFFSAASAQSFKRFIFTPTTVGLLGFNDTMLSASNE